MDEISPRREQKIEEAYPDIPYVEMPKSFIRMMSEQPEESFKESTGMIRNILQMDIILQKERLIIRIIPIDEQSAPKEDHTRKVNLDTLQNAWRKNMHNT